MSIRVLMIIQRQSVPMEQFHREFVCTCVNNLSINHWKVTAKFSRAKQRKSRDHNDIFYICDTKVGLLKKQTSLQIFSYAALALEDENDDSHHVVGGKEHPNVGNRPTKVEPLNLQKKSYFRSYYSYAEVTNDDEQLSIWMGYKLGS